MRKFNLTFRPCHLVRFKPLWLIAGLMLVFTQFTTAQTVYTFSGSSAATFALGGTNNIFTITSSLTGAGNIEPGSVFYDDGGPNANYDDAADLDNNRNNGADPIVYTFCPDNPITQRVRINFTMFDVKEGDIFQVFDISDPFVRDEDDEIQFDRFGNPYYNLIPDNPSFGTGVTSSPGSGWVQASCDNYGGCLTVYWLPNNDGQKGAGWALDIELTDNEFSFSCEDEEAFITVTCSEFVAGLAGMYEIPAVDFEQVSCVDMTEYGLFVETVSGLTYTAIDSEGNTVTAPFKPGDMLLFDDVSRGDMATLNYSIYPIDKDGDIDGGIVASGICTTKLTVTEFPPLACNDGISISLDPLSCQLKITPDHILENPCFNYENEYYVQVEDSFGDEVDGGVIHNEGIYTVTVGYYDYPEYNCQTTVTIKDQSAPVCAGIDYDFNNDREIEFKPVVICTEQDEMNYDALFEDVQPEFNDCSDISIIESYDEVYLECGNFDIDDDGDLDADEMDLIDETRMGLMSEWNEVYGTTSPFSLHESASGAASAEIRFTDPATMEVFQVERIIKRTWRATDDSNLRRRGSYGCPVYVAIIKPMRIYIRQRATVECTNGGVSIDPSGLPDGMIPYFVYGVDDAGVAVPYNLSLDHSVCYFGLSSRDDYAVDACGNTSKQQRQWTVIDWCEGVPVDLYTPGRDDDAQPSLGSDLFKNPQIVDVIDTRPPTITIPTTFQVTYSMSDFDCDAYVTIPAVEVNDICNSVEVSITVNGSTTYSNGGDFTGFGIGTHEATFTATDACGNSTSETIAFEIEDNQPPSVNCETERRVSLGHNCTTRIYAESLTDESFDNCTPITLEVRRLGTGYTDEDFGAYIEFSETDLQYGCPSEPFPVILRATDQNGNYNSCTSVVILEDRIAPTCESAERTFDCRVYGYLFDDNTTDDIINEALNGVFGAAVRADNCGEAFPVYGELEVMPGTCGDGVITRVIRYEDACGNQSQACLQRLIVTNTPDWKITFPVDYEVNCDEGDEIPAPLTMEELLDFNSGCNTLGLKSVTDDTIAVDDACYKIIREYVVIDWCTWTLETQAKPVARPINLITSDANRVMLLDEDAAALDGYFYYRQVIKVSDNTAPFVSIAHDTACDDDGDCAENQDFVITVFDECSRSVGGTYSLNLNHGEPSSTVAYISGEFSGNVFSFTAEDLPVGTHALYARAYDGCGNYSGLEELIFEITDCKAPAPQCLAQIIMEVMPVDNGMTEIWATDFIASDVTDCSGQVKYSFSPTEYQPSLIASNLCTTDTEDSEGLIVGANLISIYALDPAGNAGECNDIVLIVQDNRNVCGASGGSTIMVGGSVQTETGMMVSDVNVSLNGDGLLRATSDQNGTFSFTDLVPGYDYSVYMEKEDRVTNGVSTFDLVLITKHILNIQSLDSPYKLIAADANNSGTVTTFDMVTLRKTILNITDELPNNTSWRFIPRSFAFPNANDPWATGIPEVLNFNNLSTSELEANFYAVKVGDVNNNVTLNGETIVSERTTNQPLTIKMTNQLMKKGMSYTVELTTDMLESIEGMQFTLDFDPTILTLTDVTAGVFGEEHLGLTDLDNGKILLSWNKLTETTANTLITLTFEAQQTTALANVLQINSSELAAEAYNTSYEVMPVQLSFDEIAVAEQVQLYQNQPNPFAAQTAIRFYLPESSRATLTIRDINGKTVKTIVNQYDKGQQELTVSSDDLPTGILYYTLETNNFTDTKKMIVLK